VSCELGAGEITKKGNGTVILSGPGKYLGKIKVLGGDLFFGGPNSSTRHFEMAQVGKELIGEPRLHLAHEDEWVHSETIDGLNSLHKSGGGVLTLTGDNTYVGPTSVMEGTLRVNGSITSDVTVHPGATLGGTGVIAGNVAMGGTMAPGASIGTTTVVGNYDQLSGSTFEVELNASMNDFLTVSGGVTIHPETTLVLLPESGGYRPGQTFNIVHADGGVQGIFSTVNLRGNAFTPQILYTSDDIFLLILNINLSSRVSGGNAGNVATYLDSLTSPANSDLSSVVAVAASLNNAGLKDALNQMQPSSLKDFVIAQEGASFLVESSVQQRLRDVNHTTCPRQNPGLSFWMDDAYQFASQNSEGQNVGYHAATFAVTAGLDYDYMKDLYVGFFTSYSYSSLSLQRHRGNGFTETFYGGTYATYASKYVDASAILMGSTHRMHAKRFIDFSTIDRTAYSVRRGGEVDGHLDLGVRIQRGSILVRPYGTVDYLYLHESEYAEHGADSLDLVVRSSNSALFRYEIGLGLTDCYRFNDQRGYFEAKAGVAHEQRYFGKEYTLHFRGQPGNFTVNGLSPTRTVFVPAFSWSHLFEKFTLSLRAEGEVGSKYAMGELGLQATF
jgi:outer membrane autotransporter protein